MQLELRPQQQQQQQQQHHDVDDDDETNENRAEGNEANDSSRRTRVPQPRGRRGRISLVRLHVGKVCV